VEDPFALAGAYVETPDVAFHIPARGGHVTGGVRRAHHHHIARHQRRGMQADIGVDQIDGLVEILFQIDQAIVAERRIGNAGRGIQRDQLIADGDVKDALLAAVGPIGHAMARKLARRIGRPRAFIHAVHPQQLARFRINRHAIAARSGGGEQAALDEQRRRFKLIFLAGAQNIGLEAPRHFQIAKIARVDLVQRRIARVGLIGGIVAPFRVGLAGAGAAAKARPALPMPAMATLAAVPLSKIRRDTSTMALTRILLL
jgi:hypothetical protein